MDILKLWTLHNTMFEKIIYRLNGVVKLAGLSNMGFTASFNTKFKLYEVQCTYSKHVAPHLGSSYASRSTSNSSLQCHHILVHGSFLCQASFAEWNSLSICAIQ